MIRNRLIVSSSLGRYLVGDHPVAATNSFLYHEPSVLLWADQLVCDYHALAGERSWAGRGVLISEIFAKLADHGLVKPHAMERHFTPAVREALIAVSESDRRSAPLSAEFFPTVTINPARASPDYNGFLDINSHLFICGKLQASFLEESTTAPFYRWKLAHSMGFTGAKERAVLNRILDLRVPSFALFPRNRSFSDVRAATATLFRSFQQCCAGRLSLRAYHAIYDQALKVFEAYEAPIRSEVLDNLAQILEVRADRRVKRLRQEVRSIAERITTRVDNGPFRQEVDLEVQRTLLEVERSLAEDLVRYDKFEKLQSYVSPGFSLAALAGGTAAALVTQNPALVLAGAAPQAVAWGGRFAKALWVKKAAWYSYVVDVEKKLTRSAQLRDIDAKLKRLRQRPG